MSSYTLISVSGLIILPDMATDLEQSEYRERSSSLSTLCEQMLNKQNIYKEIYLSQTWKFIIFPKIGLLSKK